MKSRRKLDLRPSHLRVISITRFDLTLEQSPPWFRSLPRCPPRPTNRARCVANVLFPGDGKRSNVLPQQHPILTAVRVVAFQARFFDRRSVQPKSRRRLMTRKADSVFRHRQAHYSHVPLSRTQMANTARRLHRRVHELAGHFRRMARGATRILWQ